MPYSMKEVNDAVRSDPKGFAEACDAAFAKKVENAAQKIADHRRQSHIILLSGPSGSGKTTLLRQLAEEGISQRSTKGETLQQIRRGGVHGRYLVVARGILDDEKTPEQAKTLAKGHQLGMEEIDEMPDNPF